jgi:hypothetical protein
MTYSTQRSKDCPKFNGSSHSPLRVCWKHHEGTRILLVRFGGFPGNPSRCRAHVTTNFESGSARVLAINEETQTIRVMPAGDPVRGWPCWWYLRVDGVTSGKPLTLEVVGSSATLPAHRAKSARKLDPAWALPARAAISANGKSWAQTDAGERRGNIATYRIEGSANTVWLAWGPPFTPGDTTAWIEATAGKHPFAKPFTLASSREGRPVPAMQIREGAKPDAERLGVWILVRQHAWESGGSWVGVGLGDWIAGADETRYSFSDCRHDSQGGI